MLRCDASRHREPLVSRPRFITVQPRRTRITRSVSTANTLKICTDFCLFFFCSILALCEQTFLNIFNVSSQLKKLPVCSYTSCRFHSVFLILPLCSRIFTLDFETIFLHPQLTAFVLLKRSHYFWNKSSRVRTVASSFSLPPCKLHFYTNKHSPLQGTHWWGALATQKILCDGKRTPLPSPNEYTWNECLNEIRETRWYQIKLMKNILKFSISSG